MAIIAVLNLKGGVGKSTIAANLAGELATVGESVVVLDTDPQHSLVAWARLGNGILSQCVVGVDTSSVAAFQQAIERESVGKTHIIIDCPPGFADPALLAALFADLVLLPVGASPLDVMSAKEAVELAREARAQRGTGKPEIRLVPSRVQTGTTLGRSLESSLEGLGEPIFPSIGQRVALAESVLVGQVICEYAPFSTAAHEFETLAKAVGGLI